MSAEKFSTSRPGGLILAGGASSRFGSDKARAVLNHESETMLDRALDLMISLADPVYVVAPADRDYPNLLVDRYPGQGPFGGLITGLFALQSSVALVMAVDQFALDASTLQRLIDAWRPDTAVVFQAPGEPLQPLPLAISTSLVPALDELWRGGYRSLSRALDAIGTRTIPPLPGDELQDADTPSDLCTGG